MSAGAEHRLNGSWSGGMFVSSVVASEVKPYLLLLIVPDGAVASAPAPHSHIPTSPQVWIWATALTYLVWRFKWRRDRRLAAEQFAHEQQQEQELQQEWHEFAKSYGVNTPRPGGTS